jgi:class 3 adenylate cyclase
VHLSLDILDAIQAFNASRQHPLSIRIVMSPGAATARVIGKNKFLRDLWGEVVNTASRIDSHGAGGRTHWRDATRQDLIQSFAFEQCGVIEVKGKGEMGTGFLNNRQRFAYRDEVTNTPF